MFVVGFLLAITFWPGLSGAAEASRWATLCLLVPTALFFVRVEWTAVHIAGAILLGYAVLSLAWTPVRYDGVAELMQLTILAGAFLIGAGRGADGLWKGLGAGLIVSSALCVLQAFNIQPVTTAGYSSPAGLFVNPDVLGEVCAVVFVALVIERSWLLALGVLPALVLSECRSALLAVFVCVALIVWSKWRWRVLYGLPLVAGGVLLTAWKWALSGGETARLNMWHDTWAGLTMWGHGVGSFYSVMPIYSTDLSDLFQSPHAHNDLLELAFELGVIPAVFAALLLSAIFYRADFKDRLLLTALGAMSMVGFPLHSPATVFIFGIVAGCASRNWNVLRAFKFAGRRGLYKGGQRPDYAGAGASGSYFPVQP